MTNIVLKIKSCRDKGGKSLRKSSYGVRYRLFIITESFEVFSICSSDLIRLRKIILDSIFRSYIHFYQYYLGRIDEVYTEIVNPRVPWYWNI